MTEQLTLAASRACIGHAFSVQLSEDMSREMVLVEVTSLGERALRPGGTGRRECFSLVFRGPSEPVLPQAIYRFASERTGPMDVFIVPIGSDPEGSLYEAVFG